MDHCTSLQLDIGSRSSLNKVNTEVFNAISGSV